MTTTGNDILDVLLERAREALDMADASEVDSMRKRYEQRAYDIYFAVRLTATERGIDLPPFEVWRDGKECAA